MMTPEDRAQLISEITEAMRCAAVPQISEEELHWVRLAIKREAQSIAVRQAIIEKTFAGLLWSAIVGVGYLLIDFAKNHGFK